MNVRNADSPTTREDGSVVFAKPHQEDQPFPEFLDYVIRQETDPESLAPDSEVRYAQTRKNLSDQSSRQDSLLIVMNPDPDIRDRGRQPPPRVSVSLGRRPARHPLRQDSPPKGPRRHQPLDRQLAIRHGPAQGQLREHLRPDHRPEALRPAAARMPPLHQRAEPDAGHLCTGRQRTRSEARG